ncbi:DUF853 family protein [Bacillus sp. WMMC1349]|uniref:helicase HerA-like domain-containing protein n=1 Tax=Bacillus sp. WMMC1349 TaxID=2736254 RepID=UPI001553AF7F|nr:helicase HerA-like domain-containing protein [Bacillus sp. WMMC1349]NPC90868.1 DUF853 family protein [Bacillus sp. WMMC1349]
MYEFFKGKIVKPKEDVIEEYRKSGDYEKIYQNRVKINDKVQEKWRQNVSRSIGKSLPVENILLGIDEKKRQAEMALEETTKHVLFQGTTGSGKTMAILTVAESALANSQSVFFVDGKGDPKTINQFKKLTDMYGRKLHVFSEKTPLKYNPIRHGNRTSITDRIMAIFDWENAFYKNEAENFLQKVIHMLHDFDLKTDLPMIARHMSLRSVYQTLMSDVIEEEEIIRDKIPVKKKSNPSDDILGLDESEEEIEDYEVHERTVIRKVLSPRSALHMERFFGKRELSEEEIEALTDESKGDPVQELVRSMKTQLEKLIYSELGGLLEDDPEGLDLLEILERGESVIFSFNSNIYSEFIKRFARFVIADLAYSVTTRYAQDVQKGALGIFDEFGAYGSETIVHILARARSAEFGAAIGIQSLGDLFINGQDISKQVIDNCNTFFFGRSNEAASAEAVASIIGTYSDVDLTTQTENVGGPLKRIEFKSEKGTTRKVKKFYVHPDEIKDLETGVFVVVRKAAKGLTSEERRKITYFRNPMNGLNQKKDPISEQADHTQKATQFERRRIMALGALKERVSSIFSDNKIKRSKKESRKLPKIRNSKGAVVLVWALIVVLGMSGILAFGRAQNALEKSKATESALAAVTANQDENGYDAYRSPKIEIFGDQVVDEYMNIPRDSEQRKAREKALQSFYAEGLTVDTMGDVGGYRQLNHKTLYDVHFDNDKAVLQYRVDYDNVAIQQKEREVEKKKGKKKKKVKEKYEEKKQTSRTMLLNVPIRASKNGYAVVSNLYFTPVPDVKTKGIQSETNPLTEQSEAPMEQKQEIENWLKDFFKKYADGTIDDLNYMMEKPQALNGQRSFVGLENTKVYPSGKNEFVIKTNVKFQEKDISIENTESFTIYLEKRDGKYFVKKMENTLGGK